MKLSVPIRNIIFIWLGWAVILLGFQSWVQMRLELKRPDSVLNWTVTETGSTSNKDQPYLSDPFLNGHVAWDSEFYLAIADEGYAPPQVRAIPGNFGWDLAHNRYCRAGHDANCYSLAYAFFPLYPLLIRLVAFPLGWLPITQIATLTLAAVIVSLLGALLAMLSLYAMTRSSLGEEGGVRAAFYFLIFPSSFFLAQVYSEGVFLGVTFAALAFLLKRKWGWAALFAVLATWTRPGGAILLLPMAVIWIMGKTWQASRKTALLRTLAAFSPVLSYGIWRLTPLGENFFRVETLFFGRGLLALDKSFGAWKNAWELMLSGSPPTRFYYGVEFAAILLGILCCCLMVRSHPALALYGLAMVIFALTSGSAQGMIRYVLAAPPLFITLARWGKHAAFDKTWTLLSVLLMGLETLLFTFDFWVA